MRFRTNDIVQAGAAIRIHVCPGIEQVAKEDAARLVVQLGDEQLAQIGGWRRGTHSDQRQLRSIFGGALAGPDGCMAAL
jgi:hypothetical protein